MGLIAGVDEVGRGPLAGPVVAACVILDPENPILGLDDSKKLTPKKREFLSGIIKEKALAWSVMHATVEEIDEINILQATLLAMKRSIEALSITPSHVKVDGNFLPKIDISMEAVISGDKLVPAISAASIIAKVFRDNEMVEYGEVYPEYGFASHKGYGTKQHILALKEFGITPIHRRSFEPVKSMVKA